VRLDHNSIFNILADATSQKNILPLNLLIIRFLSMVPTIFDKTGKRDLLVILLQVTPVKLDSLQMGNGSAAEMAREM